MPGTALRGNPSSPLARPCGRARDSRPDFALALHGASAVPSGKVAFVPGHMCANVNEVEIKILGRGGHGALPHRAVDPIVIAARTVLALQTIVSREVNPLDPAVVTVGSIHGGTKSNVIPEEVKLMLTVRSYKDEVQDQLLAAIERIAKAEALAGRAPKEPEVKAGPRTGSVWNDPELSRRLSAAIARTMGPGAIEEGKPVMASEDFTELGRAGIPSAIFWLGAAEPKALAAAKASGTSLPTTHNPRFAPDLAPALRTGAPVLTVAALELLGRPGEAAGR